MRNPSKVNDRPERGLDPELAWRMCSGALVAWAVAMALLSSSFGYDRDVIDMPVLTLTAALVLAGVAYFCLVPSLAADTSNAATTQWCQFAMVYRCCRTNCTAGFIRQRTNDRRRLSERYLWNGAVTANGFDPYQHAPRNVIDEGFSHPLSSLAVQSGNVLQRIGHAELTTIYPPFAQAAFAMAYALAPFSLNS